MTSSDAFCSAFDAIEIDRASAPSPAAIEAAMAICAPADRLGFYLLDDGGGRFEIDREWGLISLRDESLLERERGQIHEARLRVVEPSGATYELTLRLRISGRVPQVVGEEDSQTTSHQNLTPTPDIPPLAWTDYTATVGGRSLSLGGAEQARFGLLSALNFRPVEIDGGDLRLLANLPAPAAASAHWIM
jgi:hypothetical protein